jgi:signal transduction histidine kinase
MREVEAALAELPPLPPPQAHDHAGFHSGFAGDPDSVRWVQVDLGIDYPLDAVVVIPAFLGGTGAYSFPRRFRVDVSSDPEFGESTTLLDRTTEEFRPAMAPIYIPGEGRKGRYVRFTATRLAMPAGPRTWFCLGELLVFSNGSAVSARREVTSSRAVETPPTWSRRNLVDGVSALGLPVVPDAGSTNGWHSDILKSPDHERWVQADLGEVFDLQEVRLYPTHPPDFPDRAGFGFPAWFRLEASEDAGFTQPHLLFDATSLPLPNPGDNPVPFSAHGVRARYVRLTATRLWERSDDYVLALAEMQILSGGRNRAPGATVTDSGATLAPRWQREWLVDGMAAGGRLVEWSEWLSLLSQRRELESRLLTVQEKTGPALALARQRAVWTGAGIAGLLLLWGVASSLSARRARRRELEDLRARIARDLHDEVGSHLGSISLASELALREAPDQARAALDDIHRMARQAAESMRGIVWLVREGGEPTLDRLVEALRESASTQLQGLVWDVSGPERAPRVTASLDFHRHVFLFFKEAVHNAVRHARATTVKIEVEWSADRFKLGISDDGCGFDPSAGPGSGSGLANLRHRAAALRGQVDIVSTSSSSGTTITLTVPLG